MICRKCELASTLTIRKEYNYCDSCFLSYVDHKFRACLGKNKKLKANEKVLVCLSGGISSTALLDLLHQGISLNSHKKLRVVPYFLHVTGIYETPNDEIVKKFIVEQCTKYNVQVHIVHINHYFSTSDVLYNLDSNETHTQIGRWKISNTTKSDLLTQIKQNLFIRVAKKLQCRIIFTGETTTTLAVNLLSNIAVGRGSQIENNIGFCDMKDEDAQILRPMRDITLEEVENYVKIKGLEPASSSRIQQNSLQSLIQNFVSGLQENFPATLTTICKTADKMSSNSDFNGKKKCSFCKNLLYNDAGKLTAAEATIFSSFVSSKKSDINNTTPDLNGHLELSLNNENLCYSCSTNISELSKSNETNNIQKMLNKS